MPDFEYLNGELFRAAMTEGAGNPLVNSYLDSVLRFSGSESGSQAFRVGERYRTTEAEILYDFTPPVSWIPEERGLKLVRETCDQMEKRVTALRREATGAARAGANED